MPETAMQPATVVVIRGCVGDQERLHILGVTERAGSLPTLDPVKVIRIAEESYRVAALPIGLLDHPRGKGKHIEDSAVIVQGAGDVGSGEALAKIMLIVISGLSLRRHKIADLIARPSSHCERVRSCSEIERRLHSSAVDKILVQIPR